MNYDEVARCCFAVAGAGGILGVAAALAGLMTDQATVLEVAYPFLAAGSLAWVLGVALGRLRRH